MKELKDLFTIIRIQNAIKVNLGLGNYKFTE